MQSQPTSIPSDWDQPFTDEDLQAIDAAIQSASSSSSIKILDSGHSPDRRPKTRRRLPDSLSMTPQQTPFTDNSSKSIPLAPCPTKWLNQIRSSTNQGKFLLPPS